MIVSLPCWWHSLQKWLFPSRRSAVSCVMFINWVVSASRSSCFTVYIKCVLQGGEQRWCKTYLKIRKIKNNFHNYHSNAKRLKIFATSHYWDSFIGHPAYIHNIQHCIRGNYIYIFIKCSVRLETFIQIYRQILFIYKFLWKLINPIFEYWI